MKVFINLIGTLFMRTVERADRIYYAMLSRGFSGTIHYIKRDRLRKADFVCLFVTGVFLILFRTYEPCQSHWQAGRKDVLSRKMTHHIIDFKDVVFRYPDGTEALKGVSFRITHGESVGIVGANGAGKSTLLLQMNGYMLPSSGLINIGNLELTKKTRQEIRKKIGVVFQNPDDQLFMPTVYDDVAFGPLNLGMSVGPCH